MPFLLALDPVTEILLMFRTTICSTRLLVRWRMSPYSASEEKTKQMQAKTQRSSDFMYETCGVIVLTELNMDVRVRRVVTQRTIRPGTISLGTRKDSQATVT